MDDRLRAVETAVASLAVAVTTMHGQLRWRATAVMVAGWMLAAGGAAITHGGDAATMLNTFLKALATTPATEGKD